MKIGSRWDGETQNSRIKTAKENQLIEFIEVNYPITPLEKPFEVDLPIYAHSANNGLCSASGLNLELVNMIKREADKYQSPWIGEHLSWTHFETTGALGYVFNTIYNEEFFNITQKNINKLQSIYKRDIAIELGPQYGIVGDYDSEIDFMLDIAKSTNTKIILDLSHLIISNNNLKRKIDFGIDKILSADIVEVHVSGIRKSSTQGYWHDCHDIIPEATTMGLLKEITQQKSSIQAITLEHSVKGSEQDFMIAIEGIHKVVSQ